VGAQEQDPGLFPLTQQPAATLRFSRTSPASLSAIYEGAKLPAPEHLHS